MSEEKFVICPNCGALLDKGVQFCGFCGSNVNEKKSTYSQPPPPQQPVYQQPQQQPQYDPMVDLRNLAAKGSQQYGVNQADLINEISKISQEDLTRIAAERLRTTNTPPIQLGGIPNTNGSREVHTGRKYQVNF